MNIIGLLGWWGGCVIIFTPDIRGFFAVAPRRVGGRSGRGVLLGLVPLIAAGTGLSLVIAAITPALAGGLAAVLDNTELPYTKANHHSTSKTAGDERKEATGCFVAAHSVPPASVACLRVYLAPVVARHRVSH